MNNFFFSPKKKDYLFFTELTFEYLPCPENMLCVKDNTEPDKHFLCPHKFYTLVEQ